MRKKYLRFPFEKINANSRVLIYGGENWKVIYPTE